MSIIKSTVVFTIGTFLAQFLGVFTSLATRKYLTPELMGIWSLMLLILSYLSFGHCGIFTAVEVRIPYLRGRKEDGEISPIRNIAFSVSLMLSLLIMVSSAVIIIFLSRYFSGCVVSGIKWVSLIGIATVFYNLYISFLRADKNFTVISVATVVNAALLLVLTIVLGKLFGLTGIYCATLLATILSFTYLLMGRRYDLHWCLEFKRTKQLFLIGFPILVFGFFYTIFISADKILIIKMLGAKALGFYSIAILAFTYASTIPKLFTIVIFPDMQEVLGKTGKYDGLIDFVKKPSVIMSYIFPPALALIYYLLPLVVVYFIPRYTDGVASMQILLAGCFFISFAYLPQNIIISRNMQLVLLPLTVLALLIGILLNFTAVKLGYGIEGVAAGTSIAYFIYFLTSFYYAMSISGLKNNKFVMFVKLCLPLVASALFLAVIEFTIFIPNIVISAFVKLLVYLACYIPFLMHVDKKLKIIPFVLSRIKKRPLVEAELINEA